jgi:hypothetical protein
MAGMTKSAGDIKSFEERLKRINKGGPNTSGHVIIGPVEDPNAGKKKSRRYRKPGAFMARLKQAFGHLMMVPVSFVMGAFAVFAAIVGVYHLDRFEMIPVAEAGLMQQVTAYPEVFLALALAAVLGWAFKLVDGPRKIGLVAGLALAFVLQDAVIAEYPDVFARLMSDVTLDDAIAALPPLPEL